MGYADFAAAKDQLGLSDNEPDDAAGIAMLAEFDAALSLRFDHLTGRTWGANAPEARTIEAPGVSTLLILDHPVTALASVEVGGTWNGTGWTGGTTVATTYLRPKFGGRAIERSDGAYWSGPVRVTGAWDDEVVVDVDNPVPADVVAAVTEAVTAEYRRRTMNARDTTRGFDELEDDPPPRAEAGDLWKAAVKTHTLRALVIA